MAAMDGADRAAWVVAEEFLGTKAQRVTRGDPHRAVVVTFGYDPSLRPPVEQIAGPEQRQKVGDELRVGTCRRVVGQQALDVVHRVVPIDRDVRCQRHILRIDDEQLFDARWTQSPHRGAQTGDRTSRLGVWPQRRADPEAVDGPAFQRKQCDHALAGRRQSDVLIAAVDCESAEQVERDLFRHTSIVGRPDLRSTRSALPVFRVPPTYRPRIAPERIAQSALSYHQRLRACRGCEM